MRAKKFLGQHFLKNKSKLKKIVAALDLKAGDVVIEIGPGHGELTRELQMANSKLQIIAIEKDDELANALQEKFKEDKNIEIIKGDALKILLNLITNYPRTRTSSVRDRQLPRPTSHGRSPGGRAISNYKVVGNIPYYITGYLFRILGEMEKKPEVIVLLIQKEVAERVAAKNGEMNLLAASIQYWADVEIIDYVSKKYFRPPPKVDSAIIRLRPMRTGGFREPGEQKISTSDRTDRMDKMNKTDKTDRADRVNRENYYKFIKVLFKQPRKIILNNIKSGVKSYKLGMKKEEIADKLEKVGVNPKDRPEDLGLEEIMKMVEVFEGLDK